MLDTISYCSYEQNVNQLIEKTGYSKLSYAIMFRQFEIAEKLLENSKFEDYENPDYCEFNLAECMKLNEGYIKNYEERKNISIFSDYLANKPTTSSLKTKQVFTYSECFESGRNVFDIFFEGKYPLLNIEPLKVQQKALEKVDRFGGCLVFDEVGTGKSVSAIYCIANILNKLGNQSKVLIVCPSPLRKKWKEDLRRQLGVDSHINKGNSRNRYKNGLKSVYFMEKEPCIFITGYKENQLTEAFYQWDDKQPWDLIIVDEAHIGIKNYLNAKAKSVVLLTATPIVSYSNTQSFLKPFKTVVNSRREIIVPETYRNILLKMIEFEEDTIKKEHLKSANCNPLNFDSTEEENLFVLNFREQLFENDVAVAFRQIEFKKAEVDWPNVRPLLDRLEKIVEYQLVRNHFSQDVEYLYHYINDVTFLKPKNYKKELLFDLLSKSTKSYIVFCNHQFVVNLLFDELYSIDGLIVAKKYGIHEDMKNGNFDKGSLLQQLHYQIVNGNRCVLITTGQTASVGLNLGLFDGIIHYELPYTSTELEQRFGRVDRMDVIKATGNNKKDMIFLLDQEPQQMEMKQYTVNDMLYYCTIRIDEATKYLPIRNTILFHQDLYEFFRKEYSKSLEFFYLEYSSIKRELSMTEFTFEDVQKSLNVAIKNIELEIKEQFNGDFGRLLENVDEIKNIEFKSIVLKFKLFCEMKESLKEVATKLEDLYESIEAFSQFYYESIVKEEIVLDTEVIEQGYDNLENESEMIVQGTKEIQSSSKKNILHKKLEDSYEKYKLLLSKEDYIVHPAIANGLFYRDSQGIQSYKIPLRED